MTDEKNVQMPLLPKHTNRLERVPKTGKRKSEAGEMQKLREEVYLQGEGKK
jgi:hypothetical protein